MAGTAVFKALFSWAVFGGGIILSLSPHQPILNIQPSDIAFTEALFFLKIYS